MSRHLGWRAASVWTPPRKQQFSAQPVSHCQSTVTISWRQRPHALAWMTALDRSSLSSVLISQLQCHRFTAAGQRSASQPERWTFFWHQIHPLSHNPPPVFIGGQWKKKPSSYMFLTWNLTLWCQRDLLLKSWNVFISFNPLPDVVPSGLLGACGIWKIDGH